MMESMQQVKFPPLIRSQRTQDRMIRQNSTSPSLFGFAERGIHARDVLADSPQSFSSVEARRLHLLGRFHSGGKVSDSDHYEFSETLL